MFLEVLALSPARQARGPTQPPSLRVLHTPNLSPPLRIPRLRLTGENELHHSAGHEAICLLLWNPGEIKSGQSTVIYLMYFWAGEPWPLGITFSRSGLRVYREEEQVTGCRATSSKSHPRQAGGGGRGGHFTSSARASSMSHLPRPTSQPREQKTCRLIPSSPYT